MSYLLPNLRSKEEVDKVICDTLDKVLVLRFGRASDAVCMHMDDILAKSAREVSKFASIAVVDVDAEETQVYVKYFDITLIPATVFFFNAQHMKMDSGSPDHTKWIGAFHTKQDFIDVVEVLRLALGQRGSTMIPLVRDYFQRSNEGKDDCHLSASTRESSKISASLQGNMIHSWTE